MHNITMINYLEVQIANRMYSNVYPLPGGSVCSAHHGKIGTLEDVYISDGRSVHDRRAGLDSYRLSLFLADQRRGGDLHPFVFTSSSLLHLDQK